MAEDFLQVMKVLPNPVGSFMQGQQDAANLQQTNLQNQTGAFALQQAQQQAQQSQQDDAAYQQDLGAFIQQPTAEGAANLALKHPAQAKAIQDAWNMRDTAAQNADRQGLAMVYSALSNGRPDLAKQYLQQRHDADVAIGKPNPNTEALLGMVDSAPDKAKGLAAYALASIPGGEDFAKTLTAVGTGKNETHVITQGSALVDDTGKVLYQAGTEAKYMTVKGADGSEHLIEIPRSVEGTSAAPGTSSGAGKVAAAQLLPAIKAQESGGDYAAVNKGTGALGAYQIMPATGAALAKRLGVAWNPGLMQADTPAARAYQDKLGQAAVDEAVSATSNVADAARYYHGGSNQAQWGPKTEQYATQVLGRLGAPSGSGPANIPAGARDITPTSLGGGDQTSGPFGIPPTTTGPDVLKALPAPVAARVQQLVDGRSVLTAREKGTPQGRQLMDAANMLDPLYDEGASKARMAARGQFTGNGKAAQVLGSANRLANHLGILNDASEKLVGPNLGSTTVNHFLAGIGQTFQPEALKEYDSALPLVADELEKIARGSSGSVAGIEQTIKNLRAASSLDERRAAIRTVVELVRGAVDPIQQQWDSAFGGNYKPPMPMGISSVAQHVYDTAGKDPQTQQKAPAQLSTRAQVQALPVGTQFIWTDGKVHTRK